MLMYLKIIIVNKGDNLYFMLSTHVKYKNYHILTKTWWLCVHFQHLHAHLHYF